MEQGWRLTPESLNPPGGNLQEMITSLKAEVESHKQELQAGETLRERVWRGGGWALRLEGGGWEQ